MFCTLLILVLVVSTIGEGKQSPFSKGMPSQPTTMAEANGAQAKILSESVLASATANKTGGAKQQSMNKGNNAVKNGKGESSQSFGNDAYSYQNSGFPSSFDTPQLRRNQQRPGSNNKYDQRPNRKDNIQQRFNKIKTQANTNKTSGSQNITVKGEKTTNLSNSSPPKDATSSSSSERQSTVYTDHSEEVSRSPPPRSKQNEDSSEEAEPHPPGLITNTMKKTDISTGTSAISEEATLDLSYRRSSNAKTQTSSSEEVQGIDKHKPTTHIKTKSSHISDASTSSEEVKPTQTQKPTSHGKAKLSSFSGMGTISEELTNEYAPKSTHTKASLISATSSEEEDFTPHADTANLYDHINTTPSPVSTTLHEKLTTTPTPVKTTLTTTHIPDTTTPETTNTFRKLTTSTQKTPTPGKGTNYNTDTNIWQKQSLSSLSKTGKTTLAPYKNYLNDKQRPSTYKTTYAPRRSSQEKMDSKPPSSQKPANRNSLSFRLSSSGHKVSASQSTYNTGSTSSSNQISLKTALQPRENSNDMDQISSSETEFAEVATTPEPRTWVDKAQPPPIGKPPPIGTSPSTKDTSTKKQEASKTPQLDRKYAISTNDREFESNEDIMSDQKTEIMPVAGVAKTSQNEKPNEAGGSKSAYVSSNSPSKYGKITMQQDRKSSFVEKSSSTSTQAQGNTKVETINKSYRSSPSSQVTKPNQGMGSASKNTGVAPNKNSGAKGVSTLIASSKNMKSSIEDIDYPDDRKVPMPNVQSSQGKGNSRPPSRSSSEPSESRLRDGTYQLPSSETPLREQYATITKPPFEQTDYSRTATVAPGMRVNQQDSGPTSKFDLFYKNANLEETKSFVPTEASTTGPPSQCVATVPRLNLHLDMMLGEWYPAKVSSTTSKLWVQSFKKEHNISDIACLTMKFSRNNEPDTLVLSLHHENESTRVEAMFVGDDKHPKESIWAISWPNGEDTLTSVVAAGVIGKERSRYNWLLTVDCDLNGIVEPDWAVMARIPEGISNSTMSTILAIVEGLKGLTVEDAITYQSDDCHK